MMNLILVLIVPMMSNTMKQLRQLSTILTKLHKLLSANQAIPILINHFYHAFNCLGLDVGGYRSRGLVFESVRCVEVIEVPGTAVVEVVKAEEGAGVEVRDVVLLCDILVIVFVCEVQVNLPAKWRVAQSASSATFGGPW